MKKIWHIGTWLVGVALLLTTLAFSGNLAQEVRFSGMTVHVDRSQQQYFIAEKDVENIIREAYPFLDSLFIREININVLEERLDNHPSIRKAEVYSALDGTLRIDVTQKQPLFRVHRSGGDYYIAEQGDSMALSPNFTAYVPLVTGTISATAQEELFDFFEKTEQDSFYKNFFSGIEVAPNGAWTLFPEPGKHKVLIGQPEDIDKKLKNLQAFYKNVVNTENLDSIKTLNLAFEGQVICTKF